MKLWHLRIIDDKGDYDSFSAFVVCAATEADARAAVTRCGTECTSSIPRRWYRNHPGHFAFDADEPTEPCIWHDPSATTCACIGTATEGVNAGVIVESFHAG